MNTKQASSSWGCSAKTVREYCKSGIIPQADKKGRAWVIPDHCTKPPMTRHGLCFLIDTIYQMKGGADIHEYNWGYDSQMVIDGYKYLINNAFITRFDVENLIDCLVDSNLTDRGRVLLERENAESKSKIKFTTHANFHANLGPVGVKGGIELTNKDT
ncbi:MAG: helix-turn-helix domain-containing protein [Christensenellales bacterium]|jgi:hypothetical protein